MVNFTYIFKCYQHVIVLLCPFYLVLDWGSADFSLLIGIELSDLFTMYNIINKQCMDIA